MPVLDVYLYNTESDLVGLSAKDITAALDGEFLDVAWFGPAEEMDSGTCYIYMIDVSASMPQSFFAAAKQAVIDSLGDLGANDQVALVTFGDEAKIVLRGGESREEAEAAFGELKANESNTAFYGGVSRAMELASGKSGMRNIGIVISDGHDDTQQGIVRSELEEKVRVSGLALYGMCPDNTGKALVDEFGSFVRSSGGEIFQFNSYSAAEKMQSLHELLAQCLLLRLSAPTNQADGKAHELTIHFGNNVTSTTSTEIVHWTPDTQAPEVTELSYDAETGCVRIGFSEPVSGGEVPGNYDLKSEKGEHVVLASVRDLDGKGMGFELLPEEPPYEGMYTLTLSGITDCSMESNPVDGQEHEVELLTGVSRGIFGLPWYLFALICLVIAAIVVLLILILRKKKHTEQEQVVLSTVSENLKRHILGGDGIKLNVEINDGRGTVTRTELTLISSLIMGRSDACDVYFDDTRMSRQHCALEFEDGRLLIQDLQTTNGTFVNGSPVQARRQVQPGDKIRMGDTTLTILGIGT